MTDKTIANIRRDQYQNAPVGPSGTELEITTSDDWHYRFRRLTDNDPFELIQKRRPDGSVSQSDVVPHAIRDHFENHPSDELADANTMVRTNE